jgi:hypothetical protein
MIIPIPGDELRTPSSIEVIGRAERALDRFRGSTEQLYLVEPSPDISD